MKNIFKLAILLFAFAISALAPVKASADEADELYAQGMDFYSQKDYLSAYPCLLQAAGYGHGKARMYIGSMFHLGYGVDKDMEEAINWYKLADEENNNDIAQYNLGFIYYKGEGVDKNEDLAMHYFKKASMNGNTMAQQALESLEQVRLANERRKNVQKSNQVIVVKKK